MASWNELEKKAEEILQIARDAELTFVTAESCTGGMIGAILTGIAGSSDVVDRGFITYSNQAKMDMLGVKTETLEKYGAVSEETAAEMALGAVKNSSCDVSVAVTGIAGPGGGTAEKPVGLVYIGSYRKDGELIVNKHIFEGNRSAVRRKTVYEALELLKKQC